ncbi:hypothetical protein [Peribacillus sp. SCS-155]|uniref:hypothetical protein n=1 Tax=Peribacillus sedimenti TaxID=3115297 RepID=UPI003906B15D
MTNNYDYYEYELFANELRRLNREYEQCSHRGVKQQIYKDIQLLKTALNLYI